MRTIRHRLPTAEEVNHFHILGNVLAMRRVVAGNGQYTRIYFAIGTEAKDSISVQETPDQILNLTAL